MHTVTDSFHGYWVYPSSSLSRSRPIARLQLQSTHSAGTLLPLPLTLPFLHGRAPWLRSVVVLHSLGGRCQRLGFRVTLATPLRLFCSPRTPIVLPSLSFTLGFIVVITIIVFVGVYGKGFPVDSSPCIDLIFLFRPCSRSLISYFSWLVCGWSHTLGTWVDGFFPGAVWFVIKGFFMP